ncbi:hypothetical protein [Bacteroides uniformis]|uniref:hypothetical protein n=1 Tax=Bacteroides uniformis TaxID=820 RepID=UPI001C8B0D11|nr:hypothetical protein [Bacteroides uniformis]
MKVTKKDILSIKAGSSKVMQLDSYKDCVNARSYAYQLAFTDPREDVERYSTSIGKSSVSCPLKPSDSAPLKHSTMPP